MSFNFSLREIQPSDSAMIAKLIGEFDGDKVFGRSPSGRLMADLLSPRRPVAGILPQVVCAVGFTRLGDGACPKRPS